MIVTVNESVVGDGIAKMAGGSLHDSESCHCAVTWTLSGCAGAW